jgi:predicted nucleic acid-binding protein
LGLRVRAVTPAIVRASEAVRAQEGLLTNDSVTIAFMRKLELENLATHDSDLMNIPGLIVYRPEDIP